MATRAARKLFDDSLSAAKCKSQAEAHAAVSAEVAVSKVVADQGSMIKLCSNPKDYKMNTTCNTDKRLSFQTPNALENISQNLKVPNHFSQSNLATQVGKDKMEDSDKITLH